MPLTEEFGYRSTVDGSPPTGRKKTGTFRDVSLVGMKPEHIDEVDFECQNEGITRSAWAMKAFGSVEGRRRFHKLFAGTKPHGYERIWHEIDKEVTTPTTVAREELLP